LNSGLVFADSIPYVFAGKLDLSGSLALDNSTGFTATIDPHDFRLTNYHHESLGDVLNGSFGDFDFSGGIVLNIADWTPYNPFHPDIWYLDSKAITSNAVNGRSMTFLRFLIYSSFTGASFNPPAHLPDPEHFSYVIGYSDGSFENHGLDNLDIVSSSETKASVPESPTWIGLAVGLLIMRPWLIRRDTISPKHSK